MGRIIKKKIVDCFADAVLDGSKTFEIRENEEGYQKGDIIEFQVIYPDMLESITHPLNGKQYEITYVLSGWGLKDGYVALAIRPLITVDRG